MISDEDLISAYLAGFRDELTGSSSIDPDIELERKAYDLGVAHAIIGDDVSSIDNLTNDEILKIIKDETN
jgi:high-affinity nickel permease